MRKTSLFLVFLIVTLALSLSSFHVPTLQAQETETFGNPTLPDWLDVTVTEDSDFVIVDNSDGFVFKFRKGTAGYNEIWQNGSQIVANEQWVLEYLAEAKWKQRGTPQYVTWEQPQSYHVVVKRFYDDFLGTTFNISYSFYGGFRPKIMFEGFIGQAEEYRIQWKISGINKTHVQNEENYIKFWNSDEEAIVFDYSDVYESFGDITDVELDVWAGNHKLNEIFNVGFLNVGTFCLDPNFGYETLGIGGQRSIEDYIRGSVFTITEAGTAESITAGLDHLEGYPWEGYVRCLIWKHSDLSLVGETEERYLDLTDTPTFYTFNFDAPKPDLTIDTAYILGSWSQAAEGYAYMVFDAGDTDQGHRQSIDYNTAPDPLVPATLNTNKFSIYCTYTTEEGQDLTFTLSETVSPTATGTKTMELGYTHTETIQPTESLVFGKEIRFSFSEIVKPLATLSFGKEVSFILSEAIAFSETVTKAIEKLLVFSETVNIESVLTASLELFIEFFEFWETISITPTLEATLPSIVEIHYATIGFVVAIVVVFMSVVMSMAIIFWSREDRENTF